MSRESWPIPVLWPGETVVIIGGGPSFDLAQNRLVAMARLANKCRVIAVNDGVFGAWWADWLHSCDSKWWIWHKETALKFPGIRTTCTETVPEKWAKLLRVRTDKETGRTDGFADEPDTLAGGGNGGYQAIQIGVKAGGKRVILLGFDMQPGEDGKAHWFGDHPDKMKSDYKETMLPNFPTLVEPMKARGVEVINASPGSAIDCFPRARLETLL